jgi:hypothetical protein
VVPFLWLVVVFHSLLLTPASAEILEMTKLMTHPQHYDRKEVVVVGAVSNVQSVIDKQGHPGFQFILEDPTGRVKVLSRTKVRNGEHIVVEGTFTRRRQGGRLTVYNEVTAASIRPLNQFDPDFVG